MSWNLEHSLVELEDLRKVLLFHLPLDIVIPQLVTSPFPPTLGHGPFVLASDEGNVLLLDSLAVVHEVDPQVGRQGDGGGTLEHKYIHSYYILDDLNTNLCKHLHHCFRSSISLFKISKLFPVSITVWVPL